MKSAWIYKGAMRTILLLGLSSCAIWPYKSDFDCPHPKGEHCMSLYEVNIRADEGKYKSLATRDRQTISCCNGGKKHCHKGIKEKGE